MEIESCPIISVKDTDADRRSVLVTIKSKRAGKKDSFRVPRMLNSLPVTTDDVCEVGWSSTGERPVYALIHQRIVGPVFEPPAAGAARKAAAVETAAVHKRNRARAASLARE